MFSLGPFLRDSDKLKHLQRIQEGTESGNFDAKKNQGKKSETVLLSSSTQIRTWKCISAITPLLTFYAVVCLIAHL